MKKIAVLVFAAALALVLCACGGGSSSQGSSGSAGAAKKTVEVVELNDKSSITHEGDYTLSGMYTHILSDSARADGWYYYYSEGTENGTPWIEWKCADGTYTSCEILYNMKNLNKNQTETFMSRFSGFIVYNYEINLKPSSATAAEYMQSIRDAAAKDSKIEIFDFTTLQENPGQLDSDGYPANSKDATLLKYNETAKQRDIADVSANFYNSWANKQSEPMWAVFSYDEGTVYVVNLRTYLVDMDANATSTTN